MDVIGTTIAILQLIGKITTYTRTASGSRNDRERLRTQLQACENVIYLLQDNCPSNASPKWIQAMNRLAEPGKPLDCLLKALDSAASKLLDGTGFMSALKWPFEKNDVETLMKVVDQNINLLLVALNNESVRLLDSLNEQFDDQKARIEELRQKVQTLGQDGKIQMQMLADKLSGIQISHMETKSGIDWLKNGQEKRESSEQRHEILNWLTRHDHSQQQSYIFSNRLVNTGGWFLCSDQYMKWKHTTGQTLMCRGVPGAGKTILTSIVVEDLRAFSCSELAVGVAFIYCDYKLRHQQTGDMLLTSLLKQLVEGLSTLPSHIQKLYNHHEKGKRSLSSEDIRATLRSVTSSYRRILIAVDALDEGEDHHLTTFFSEVFYLQKKFGVNVITTTRPAVTERLSGLFKGALEIEISAKDEDVQRYVEARMHELPDCVSKGRLEDDIKKKILECVDGMFLLAKLHMASLKDLATPTEIRREIQNLRQGSDSYKIAYETAVQRIRGQSVSRTKLANKVLAWIVYAKRVLKASELRLMLGVEVGKRKLDYDFCPDVDMMVSVCAGLVTIDEKADTIRLVHYTAQTFFDNAKSTILPSAETEIAKICITYLSLKVFARPQDGDGYPRDSPSEGEEDEEPLEQHSSNHSQGSVLYDYAAQYWGVHAREAPDAQGDVMRFLSRKRYITRAYETATKLHGYEYWEASLVSVDGLHLAAMLGLEQAVKQILHARLSHPDVVIDLEHWSDHPDGTEFYLTPLTIAAAQNRSDIVEILLEFGATVGVVSLDRWKDYKGTTALHVASEKGFEVIIDMLLQADAKSHSQRSMGDAKNTQTGRHEQPTESTLCIGPQKSHDELERLLQQTPRPTVDLPDLIGWLSLCIASCRGFDKIVDVLLRYGANMNFQSKSKNIMRRSVSPLYVASENGHLAIVKTLLHHGSKVHGYNSSPLYAACANGHIDIAKILLLKGVNMNAVHKSHSSPLHVACSKGYIDIAEMLLQEGASVDAPHHGKYSPLYGAASNGYTEIVRMLLKEGANVNAPHHGNYSPLYGAAFNGHTEIVQILLQEGAKVNAPHHGQQSPLDGAASNGHIEISKLLLHHGSEVNPHDSQSSSCLHGASAAGHVEMVKMLLEHGASTHLGKAARQSPIHAAIEHGRLEVFNLLIRHGANPNQWRSIKTPLQFAMDLQQQYGASSTVETMIEQLRELGGKTSRELRLQETLQLMQERREKNARSAEQ